MRALDEQSLPDVLHDYCKQFTDICKAAFHKVLGLAQVNTG